MERLTVNKPVEEMGMMTINEAIKHCKDKADCIECGKEHSQLAEWLEELKAYKDAEEQGLLLKLPCKVGDKIYQISEGFIEPCTMETIFLNDYTDENGEHCNMAEIHYDREDCPWVSCEIYFTDFGKTVFLTKEEAEKALERMG